MINEGATPPSFINDLTELQENLGLEKKALQGIQIWLDSEELGLDPTIVKNLGFSFKFHKLCFKHECIAHPYIETTLRITYQGGDIGYYSLYSALNGEPIDDTIIITDKELKQS